MPPLANPSHGNHRLEQVWRQHAIPVCYRRGKGHPLLVRLPFAVDNRTWLQAGRRRRPSWLPPPKGYWELPASWLNDLVDRGIERWGSIYVIQPYREREACAPACWRAEGHECECSCMGAHHGSQSPAGAWFVVSETFATIWRERSLACRLVQSNNREIAGLQETGRRC